MENAARNDTDYKSFAVKMPLYQSFSAFIVTNISDIFVHFTFGIFLSMKRLNGF